MWVWYAKHIVQVAKVNFKPGMNLRAGERASLSGCWWHWEVFADWVEERSGQPQLHHTVNQQPVALSQCLNAEKREKKETEKILLDGKVAGRKKKRKKETENDIIWWEIRREEENYFLYYEFTLVFW